MLGLDAHHPDITWIWVFDKILWVDFRIQTSATLGRIGLRIRDEVRLRRDIILALTLLAFSGLYWLGADGIVESEIDTGVGAQALPKALAYALAALSLLLVAQTVIGHFFVRSVPKGETEHDQFLRSNHLRAFGVVAIGGLYLAIVSYTGYLVGLIILMGITAVYMRCKPSWGLGAIVTAGAIFYWLLFV